MFGQALPTMPVLYPSNWSAPWFKGLTCSQMVFYFHKLFHSEGHGNPKGNCLLYSNLRPWEFRVQGYHTTYYAATCNALLKCHKEGSVRRKSFSDNFSFEGMSKNFFDFRFGRIPALKTIKAVKKGEEMLSHYKVTFAACGLWGWYGGAPNVSRQNSWVCFPEQQRRLLFVIN